MKINAVINFRMCIERNTVRDTDFVHPPSAPPPPSSLCATCLHHTLPLSFRSTMSTTAGKPESAMQRSQRIRSAANAALQRTSVPKVKAVERSTMSPKITSLVRDIRGKQDVAKTMRHIEKSEQKTEMRKRLGSFMNRIQSSSPAVKIIHESPSTLADAISLLKSEVHLPVCVEAVNMVTQAIDTYKLNERDAKMGAHVAKEEVSLLHKQLSKLQMELSTEKGIREQLETKLASYANMEHDQEQLLGRFKKVEQTLGQELDNAHKQMTEIQSQNDRLRDEIRSLSGASTEEVDKIKATLAWTENELDALNQKFQDTQTENDVLRTRSLEKSNATNDVLKKFQDENHELRETVGKLQSSLAVFENQGSELQSTKKELNILHQRESRKVEMMEAEASRREQRMADIIAWLLELHSGSDGDQSQYKDLQSNEMLRELREVYLNEVGLEFQRLRTEPSPDHLSLC
jgi:hypothetical protein